MNTSNLQEPLWESMKKQHFRHTSACTKFLPCPLHLLSTRNGEVSADPVFFFKVPALAIRSACLLSNISSQPAISDSRIQAQMGECRGRTDTALPVSPWQRRRTLSRLLRQLWCGGSQNSSCSMLPADARMWCQVELWCFLVLRFCILS